MKLIVKGIHLKLTKRLRAFVEEHLALPLEHFCDDAAAKLEVHLADTNGPKGGVDKECRATVRLPRSKALHVSEASDDIYKSIAFARDRLERMAKREIQKMRQGSGHPIGKPAGRLAPRGVY